MIKLPPPRIIEFTVTDYPMLDANQAYGILALVIIICLLVRLGIKRSTEDKDHDLKKNFYNKK